MMLTRFMHRVFIDYFFLIINHILQQEKWIHDVLRSHTHKIIRIQFSNFILDCSVTDDGTINLMHDGCDNYDLLLVFEITTDSLFSAVVNKDYSHATKSISVSGDMNFMSDINFLFRNMHWNIKEDLSELFVNIISIRILLIYKIINSALLELLNSLFQNIMEYLLYEQQLLVSKASINQLSDEIRKLNYSVETIDNKITKLSSSLRALSEVGH